MARELKTYLRKPIKFFLEKILLLSNKEVRTVNKMLSSKYTYEYREL